MTTVAEVRLWGRRIAAVSVEGPGEIASFEYEPAFIGSGIEVAPLMMPLESRIYRFPDLPAAAFHGLPGMLADALPDAFGNAVIDAWLAAQGRLPDDIDAVERLCYSGQRSMGALEFRPARGPRSDASVPLQINALLELASEVLRSREQMQSSLADPEREHALREILRVSASAGGARAKAVIAWNPATNEVRSGQVTAPPGFEYWLLKFDGVGSDRDAGLADSQGFGAVEYAYALMAHAAGVHMSECRLFQDGERRHFMTRRFDRLADGEKLHMQSLAAMAHFDFNNAGGHSYEQAITVIRRIGLPMETIEQQFRRMVFNVVACNRDDHVKNLAFLMDKSGAWSLAPAFDLTYSYNPAGRWTSLHQMSLNGKRDDITMADFDAVAKTASMARGRTPVIVKEVCGAVAQWRDFAKEAGVDTATTRRIASAQRSDLAS